MDIDNLTNIILIGISLICLTVVFSVAIYSKNTVYNLRTDNIDEISEIEGDIYSKDLSELCYNEILEIPTATLYALMERNNDSIKSIDIVDGKEMPNKKSEYVNDYRDSYMNSKTSLKAFLKSRYTKVKSGKATYYVNSLLGTGRIYTRQSNGNFKCVLAYSTDTSKSISTEYSTAGSILYGTKRISGKSLVLIIPSYTNDSTYSIEVYIED